VEDVIFISVTLSIETNYLSNESLVDYSVYLA
jgi:hypothetical protein